MCCRYYMELSPELRPYVEEARRSPLMGRFAKLNRSLVTEGEVRPTNVVPAIATSKAGDKTVFPMLWGFHLAGRPAPIINARVESAAEKPTFRDSFQSHRCLIPASYYYEWEHLTTPAGKPKTGDKYRIQPKDARLTYLAGLYRIEDMNGVSLPVFTVLTREPGESIRFIHNRMPVILPEEVLDDWIRPDADPTALLNTALTEMEYEKA